jgi:hypothetical protein
MPKARPARGAATPRAPTPPRADLQRWPASVPHPPTKAAKRRATGSSACFFFRRFL